MSLPRGIPTLEARNTGNWTCPDNVWRCAGTLPTVISCNRTLQAFQLPICDWEESDENLKSNLEQINKSLANLINTTNMLEQITDDLFEAIDKNKRSSTSRQNNPYTKRWWNKELTTPRRTRNSASAKHFKWRGLPDYPCHEKYRIINSNIGNAIERAKADHWEEWIEHVNGYSIWSIHKYMKADPTDYGEQRIPGLKKP